MKLQAIIVTAAMAFCAITFAKADDAQFKEALIIAARSNDPSAIMALTCLDRVSPDWKVMLEQSNLALLQQFQEKSPSSIDIVPFTEPKPQPISYKDMTLVPNLPIAAICKIIWPSDATSAVNPTSTDIRLGLKDGKLMIVALVPETK